LHRKQLDAGEIIQN